MVCLLGIVIGLTWPTDVVSVLCDQMVGVPLSHVVIPARNDGRSLLCNLEDGYHSVEEVSRLKSCVVSILVAVDGLVWEYDDTHIRIARGRLHRLLP